MTTLSLPTFENAFATKQSAQAATKIATTEEENKKCLAMGLPEGCQLPVKNLALRPEIWSGFIPPASWKCIGKNYIYWYSQAWGDNHFQFSEYLEANGWADIKYLGQFGVSNELKVQGISNTLGLLGSGDLLDIRIDGSGWTSKMSDASVDYLLRSVQNGLTLVLETEFAGFDSYDPYFNQLMAKMSVPIRRDESRYVVTSAYQNLFPSWYKDSWFYLNRGNTTKYAITTATANLLQVGPGVRSLYQSREGLIVMAEYSLGNGRIRINGDTTNTDDLAMYYGHDHPDVLEHQALLKSCTNQSGGEIGIPPTVTPSITPTPSRTPTSTQTSTVTIVATNTQTLSTTTSPTSIPSITSTPVVGLKKTYLPLVLKKDC